MSVSPSSFSKQPNEKFSINLDFSKRVVSGSEITSKTITVCEYEDNAESTVVTEDIIIGSSINADKQSITIGIMGGEDGKVYKIEVLVTTNTLLPDDLTYSKYEADIFLSVND